MAIRVVHAPVQSALQAAGQVGRADDFRFRFGAERALVSEQQAAQAQRQQAELSLLGLREQARQFDVGLGTQQQQFAEQSRQRAFENTLALQQIEQQRRQAEIDSALQASAQRGLPPELLQQLGGALPQETAELTTGLLGQLPAADAARRALGLVPQPVGPDQVADVPDRQQLERSLRSITPRLDDINARISELSVLPPAQMTPQQVDELTRLTAEQQQLAPLARQLMGQLTSAAADVSERRTLANVPSQLRPIAQQVPIGQDQPAPENLIDSVIDAVEQAQPSLRGNPQALQSAVEAILSARRWRF